VDNGEFKHRFKEDVTDFTGELEKIFVNASVEVLGSARGLADRLFDDLKSAVDVAANRVRSAGDKADDYVRRNPWVAAAAFLALSALAHAVVSRKREPQAQP
jgi:ElaB/YqjD/DUF883 family membrane-anchored ribosome-binding protein